MQQRDQDVTTEADTADVLRAALAALKDSGADHLDPVRFHYIQAMTARAERQHTAVARLLLSKAWHALQSYQTQLVEQRAAAAPLLEQASARHPDLAEQARQLYDSCEFKALRRLARTQQQYDAPDSLASLTRQLQAGTGDNTPTNLSHKPSWTRRKVQALSIRRNSRCAHWPLCGRNHQSIWHALSPT